MNGVGYFKNRRHHTHAVAGGKPLCGTPRCGRLHMISSMSVPAWIDCRRCNKLFQKWLTNAKHSNDFSS